MDFRIRRDYELPGDAPIVRLGAMLPKDLERAAENCLAKVGVLGITVYGADVPTHLDLLDQMPNPAITASYGSICIATAKDLNGFKLLPTGAQPHYTLELPGLDAIEEVRGRFEVVPNPVYRTRG